jgi:hypothetical protein
MVHESLPESAPPQPLPTTAEPLLAKPGPASQTQTPAPAAFKKPQDDIKTQLRDTTTLLTDESRDGIQRATDAVGAAVSYTSNAVREGIADLREHGMEDLRKDKELLQQKVHEIPPLGNDRIHERPLHTDSTTAPPTRQANAAETAYEIGRVLREESESGLRQAKDAVVRGAQYVKAGVVEGVKDLKEHGADDVRSDAKYLKQQYDNMPPWDNTKAAKTG